MNAFALRRKSERSERRKREAERYERIGDVQDQHETVAYAALTSPARKTHTMRSAAGPGAIPANG